MSFSLTTAQFRARKKFVTRRLGWWNIKVGQIVEGVEKGMGLKKGEKVVRLGRIKVTGRRAEPLHRMTMQPEYGKRECELEGFPEKTPAEFVAMFCKHNRCKPNKLLNRIAFEYVD